MLDEVKAKNKTSNWIPTQVLKSNNTPNTKTNQSYFPLIWLLPVYPDRQAIDKKSSEVTIVFEDSLAVWSVGYSLVTSFEHMDTWNIPWILSMLHRRHNRTRLEFPPGIPSIQMHDFLNLPNQLRFETLIDSLHFSNWFSRGFHEVNWIADNWITVGMHLPILNSIYGAIKWWYFSD